MKKFKQMQLTIHQLSHLYLYLTILVTSAASQIGPSLGKSIQTYTHSTIKEMNLIIGCFYIFTNILQTLLDFGFSFDGKNFYN